MNTRQLVSIFPIVAMYFILVNNSACSKRKDTEADNHKMTSEHVKVKVIRPDSTGYTTSLDMRGLPQEITSGNLLLYRIGTSDNLLTSITVHFYFESRDDSGKLPFDVELNVGNSVLKREKTYANIEKGWKYTLKVMLIFELPQPLQTYYVQSRKCRIVINWILSNRTVDRRVITVPSWGPKISDIQVEKTEMVPIREKTVQ